MSRGGDLHAKALLGFQSPAAAGVRANKVVDATSDVNAPYLAVAAEIKLLMMAPEKRWVEHSVMMTRLAYATQTVHH